MNPRALGLTGSAALFAGVFTPIVSLPIVGTKNYFQNGTGDGVILLVLAAISVALIRGRRFRWLAATGLVSLSILLFALARFHSIMREVKKEIETDLADNPFAGLATAMLDSVQLEWGWALLVAGAVLITAAGVMKQPAAPYPLQVRSNE